MRFRLYATASMALSVGLLSRALHKRSNFYSATVYLTQNNAGLMILINLALLITGTIMLGLQRLCFGTFRPSEIEQLYEKAWFAITETCLAMTIFREEVGAWFFVMFVALICGKVWGWIGEGRIEIVGQQPPANPRLFHARLSLSLFISTLFDILMLRYCIRTVLLQARPNMMVMFAFEFAVLTTISLSIVGRYMILLYEMAVIKGQVSAKRARIRLVDSSITEEDIDSMDIDVPGWEEKGRYVFYLDLLTDFFKLVLYLTFFCVLCIFYGMPIHIIRDVALTIRSFIKRVRDFVKYRQATDDMNSRYPDASGQEIDGECIICREELRPWQREPDPSERAGQDARTSSDERLRPKKLPCGHVLHLGCLRSWLLRQQVCPTCRRPVLENSTGAPVQSANNPEQNQGQQARNGAGPRVYSFGPFRINFFPANQQGVPLQAPQNAGELQRLMNGSFPQQATPPTNIQSQLHQIEQNLMREINLLRTQIDQLITIRQPMYRPLSANNLPGQPVNPAAQTIPPAQAFGINPNQQNLPNTQLPFTLPPGWNVIPLQRLSSGNRGNEHNHNDASSAEASHSTSNMNAPQESQSSDHRNSSPGAEKANAFQGLTKESLTHVEPEANTPATSTAQGQTSLDLESDKAARGSTISGSADSEDEGSALPKWGSAAENDESLSADRSNDPKGKGRAATAEEDTEDPA